MSPRTYIHGALDDEELFIIEGSAPSTENAANCQEWSARINNVNFQRATALREAATRSIDCAHFSIQKEWRPHASGFEFTATWKMLKFVQSLSKTRYPLSNQVRCTQDLPKHPIRCAPKATPKHRTQDCQAQGHEEMMHKISKCEQREQTQDKKIFQEHPWTGS